MVRGGFSDHKNTGFYFQAECIEMDPPSLCCCCTALSWSWEQPRFSDTPETQPVASPGEAANENWQWAFWSLAEAPEGTGKVSGWQKHRREAIVRDLLERLRKEVGVQLPTQDSKIWPLFNFPVTQMVFLKAALLSVTKNSQLLNQRRVLTNAALEDASSSWG